MKELYIDEPAKWKTREWRQIHTFEPVGMGRYVVGSLAVVGTLGEPAFDRLTVGGRVVVVTTLAKFDSTSRI